MRPAVPSLVAKRLAAIDAGGAPDTTFETMPSVLFDAVVIPGGSTQLASPGHDVEFVRDQYLHCKAILDLGSAETLFEAAGTPSEREGDWAMTADVKDFIEAMARHRN